MTYSLHITSMTVIPPLSLNRKSFRVKFYLEKIWPAAGEMVDVPNISNWTVLSYVFNYNKCAKVPHS